MKILQMHVGLSLMGGVESVIIELANALVKEHDVRVCSIFKPIENGVFFTRLSNKVHKEHLGVEKNGFSIKTLWKVFKYLKNVDADVIHIHGFFYYYFLPVLLLHKRKKFVYTFHSDAFKENSKWDKKILILKKFCLKHHWISPVTISPESKGSFTKLYKLDSRLIRNGVTRHLGSKELNDIDYAKVTSNTKVFFHPGRISEPKNQIVLCRVFQRLIEDGEDVVLLIAGTKQDESIYDKMKSLLCKRIVYLGERNDVPQLLSRADGFCLPSIWEGLPITLLESLSVGCIPICSPVGGVVGVIQNGVNGFLSQSSSEDDYYDCMKSFLMLTNEQIETIKKQCLKSFFPYEISNMVYAYLEYYKELARNKKMGN